MSKMSVYRPKVQHMVHVHDMPGPGQSLGYSVNIMLSHLLHTVALKAGHYAHPCLIDRVVKAEQG